LNARQGIWNGSRPPIGYRIVAGEQRGQKTKKTPDGPIRASRRLSRSAPDCRPRGARRQVIIAAPALTVSGSWTSMLFSVAL